MNHQALMKAFVFAVTKQYRLPEIILCYNTGAYLTCEGADTLEDLKLMESEKNPLVETVTTSV